MYNPKKHFYFQDNKMNEYGITSLKFVDLSLYNAFQSIQSSDTVKKVLEDMLRFKAENHLMQIFDFSDTIDERIMESMILPRIQNVKDDNSNPLLMIIISEQSFKNATNEIKIAIQKIALNVGRTISCYLFLVNSSKTFLELDNKRLVFAPFDDIINSEIDPITLIVETVQRKRISGQVLSIKDLYKVPTTVLGFFLFPIVIPLWSFFNFLKTKLAPKQVGSVISNPKFPEHSFEIVHQDSNYFYLVPTNGSYQNNNDYGYSGYIAGKVLIKNNNFTSLNWVEI